MSPMVKTNVLSPSIEDVKASKPEKSRWRRLLGCLLLLIMLAIDGGIYTVYHIYQTWLKPQQNEWSLRLNVWSHEIVVSVPGILRLASDPTWGPWLGKVLSGHEKTNPLGTFSLQWDINSQSLLLQCRHCVASIGNINSEPLRITQIQWQIHQDSPENYSGQILVGQAPYQISIPWKGTLSAQHLQIQLNADKLAIETIFHILAPQLPELQRAHITGTISLQAQAILPALEFTLTQPVIWNFTVSGLGTEALRNAQSVCGEPSQLPMNSWLVRSVLAAEDQRFEQHPGYDITELVKAYEENQSSGGIVRGGSTITQQTAKMLYTKSERTLNRKLAELLYAVEMEQTLGKARIMQLYLDNAPWGLYPNGHVLCGAQSAAKFYFNTTAQKLKPEQAVWLAAMLHSPVPEQKSWQKNGRINMSRALWIAQYVRNAPNSGPRARKKVIRALLQNPGLGMKAGK